MLIIPVLMGAYALVRSQAQTQGTLQAHGPMVVATYTFQNRTTAIAPFNVPISAEGGFYRVTTYTNTPPGPINNRACLGELVSTTSDFGNPVNYQGLIAGWGYDASSCVPFDGVYRYLSGMVVVHVPAHYPLTIEFPLAFATGQEKYSAYVTVEWLSK
jgi:hypothetical protein